MASTSFGKQRRPPGKEFRDGTVGEALDESVMNDFFAVRDRLIEQLEPLN